MPDKITVKKNRITLELTVIVFKQDGMVVAYAPSLDISSYGDTPEEAMEALHEAIHIFLDYTHKKNTFDENLLELGWTVQRKPKARYIPPVIEPTEIMKSMAIEKFEVSTVSVAAA